MEPAGYVAVGGLIATVLGAIGLLIVRLSRNKHTQGREVKKDTAEEYEAIFNRLEARLDAETEERRKQEEECRSELRRLRIELDHERRTTARAIARIEYHEEILTANKIKFRPWVEDDSQTHESLKPRGA